MLDKGKFPCIFWYGTDNLNVNLFGLILKSVMKALQKKNAYERAKNKEFVLLIISYLVFGLNVWPNQTLNIQVV